MRFLLPRSLLVLLAISASGLTATAQPIGITQTSDAPTFSATLTTPIQLLPFRVVDLEFSTSLNAIVAVSDAPNQLHVYNPDTATWASVNLPLAPSCVGVSPDGRRAAVGHDALISYVDLETPTLVKTLTVATRVADIVLGSQGFVYAFSNDSYIRSINLDTGDESRDYSWRTAAVSRLHPGLAKIYGADRNVSPDDIQRVDIVNGLAEFSYDSVYHGDYAMCGNVWISRDGLRLFTACGNVFRASDDPASDIRFAGKLSQETRVTWVEHSQTGNSLAVLPGYSQYAYPPVPRVDNEIHYYTHDYLLYRGKVVLPSFEADGTAWASRGRWLFFNGAGTRQYAVIQADEASKIAMDWGVVTIACDGATLSLLPASASIGAAATNLQVQVTGAPGCGWRAVSNAAWISTISSGVGDGTVSLAVAANGSNAARVGTVTIGEATFTVTQNAPVPGPVTATATSPQSVALSWSATGTVDHYEVWRNSGAGFALVGSPSGTSFTDGTATANQGYVYRVRSIVAGGGSTDFGTADHAHTFTEPVLASGLPITAAKLQTVRDIVDALRLAAGAGTAAFTDPSLAGAPLKRGHVLELRDGLNTVRTSLALSPLTFTPLADHSPVFASTASEILNGAR